MGLVFVFLQELAKSNYKNWANFSLNFLAANPQRPISRNGPKVTIKKNKD